jgi:hypothetical protein
VHIPQAGGYPGGFGELECRLRHRAALLVPSLCRQDPHPDREQSARYRGLADLAGGLEALQGRGVGRVPVAEPERGVRGDQQRATHRGQRAGLPRSSA